MEGNGEIRGKKKNWRKKLYTEKEETLRGEMKQAGIR